MGRPIASIGIGALAFLLTFTLVNCQGGGVGLCVDPGSDPYTSHLPVTVLSPDGLTFVSIANYTCDYGFHTADGNYEYVKTCDSGVWTYDSGVEQVCEDINECEGEYSFYNDCDPETMVCINNKYGGYRCECKNGFARDGEECKPANPLEGIPECQLWAWMSLCGEEECSYNEDQDAVCRCEDEMDWPLCKKKNPSLVMILVIVALVVVGILLCGFCICFIYICCQRTSDLHADDYHDRHHHHRDRRHIDILEAPSYQRSPVMMQGVPNFGQVASYPHF